MLFFPLVALTLPFCATGLCVVGDILFVAFMIITFGWAMLGLRGLPGIVEQYRLAERHGGYWRVGWANMYAVLAGVFRPVDGRW